MTAKERLLFAGVVGLAGSITAFIYYAVPQTPKPMRHPALHFGMGAEPRSYADIVGMIGTQSGRSRAGWKGNTFTDMISSTAGTNITMYTYNDLCTTGSVCGYWTPPISQNIMPGEMVSIGQAPSACARNRSDPLPSGF